MIYIDKYAWFSGMKDVNPSAKVLYGTVSLAACLCSHSFVSFAIVFATMAAVTVFRAKIPWRYYVKLMLLPLCFLLFGVLGIIVNWQSPAPKICVMQWHIGNQHFFITAHGIRLALGLTCKSMAAVSCMYFIILTTPVRDVVYILYRLKCPKIMVTLAVLIYQFIFVLLDIAATKMKSQLCRGGYRTVKGFPKTFAMLWGSVFIQSQLKCGWIEKSMSARGYDGHFPFMKKSLRLPFRDAALIVTFFLCVLLPNWV